MLDVCNSRTKLSLLPSQSRAQQGQALPASRRTLQQTVFPRVQPSNDLQKCQTSVTITRVTETLIIGQHRRSKRDKWQLLLACVFPCSFILIYKCLVVSFQYILTLNQSFWLTGRWGDGRWHSLSSSWPAVMDRPYRGSGSSPLRWCTPLGMQASFSAPAV